MRSGALLLAVLLVVGGAEGALAVPGTCTVESMGVAGEFEFGIAVDDFVFDVDIDETSGTFTFMRQAWFDEFGAEGFTFGTTGGTSTALRMEATSITGRIDGAGNLVLPEFDFTFFTSAGGGVGHESILTMSTGFTSVLLAGAPVVRSGTPLDFSTGVVTITGTRLLPDPPLLGRATVTGLRIGCRLSPIPSAEALPAGLTVKKIVGKAKVDDSFEDGDDGDTLTLKAKLAPGANPPALDGSTDVFVRIRQGDTTHVLLGVVAANQTVKGKKVVVDDQDGTLISVVEGRKETASGASMTGGKLTFKAGKKAINVSGKVHGLDLEPLLNQQLELSVAVGTQTAIGTASVNDKGKLR